MAAPWEAVPAQAAPTPTPPPQSTAPWEQPPPPPPPPTPSAPTPGFWGGALDLAKNVGTGIESGVADVLGMPRALGDYLNSSLQASGMNDRLPPQYRFGVHGNAAPLAPKSEDVRKAIVGQTGLDYVPSTPSGRIFQKATEFGTAGLAGGLPGVALGSVSGGAQQGAKELGLPEWAQNAAGIVAPIFSHSVASGTKALLRPTTQAGQYAAAQKVIDQSALNPNATIGSPPIPGAPSSLGQATNDPGILALEKGRFESSPPMVTQHVKIMQGANQAATDSLQGVGVWPNRGGSVSQMETAAGDMHQTMSDAKDAARGAERTAWEQVDPHNDLFAPVAPIKNGMEGVAKELGVSRADTLPGYVNKVIDQWGPFVPLNEVKNLRSRVLNDIRAAQSPTNPNPNAANALGHVEVVLRKTMDNIIANNPEQQAALIAARQASREYHQLFDEKNVNRTLSGAPSQAGNILRTPEGRDAYYKATGGSPEAMEAARTHFLGGLAKAAESTGAEGQTLLASPYQRHLRDNQSFLDDRRFFTEDQAEVIRKAGEQLDYSLRTARADKMGGSPTFNLLSTQQYAEALVGKRGAQFANLVNKGKTAVGALVGHHLGGGAGMVVGGMLGHGAGIPYEAAAKAVLSTVDRAVSDPVFAGELRRFRDNPNTKTMTPSIRNLLAPPANPGWKP